MTTSKLRQMKVNGEKIAMLTSYDFTLASLVDEAGIDMLLVGDSASNRQPYRLRQPIHAADHGR